ncbi:ABC-three component system middle component 1 [Heyndrickxia ginsengihumi]|uniref:ABC-three component system middle component 1 n=1 Tax=Heyndrickxia ginsengihumi TaxID=363870 RepID=UPI00203AB474|nr:ABC-three component system middle component 1 [Heyndrickxia ginsengihumi]MCM3024414.1 hypothetical protein [Heyndrickxia ginsengihumi]
MKIEKVIKVLLDENYENIILSDKHGELYENNLHIFGDKARVIFIKEFRTESSFYKWTNDQAIIASYYNSLTARLKKNLYFFMVVNFNSNNEKLLLEINKIEKDSYVCKKYIFRNIDDLTKIPFFMSTDQKQQVGFDYIRTFKDTISNLDRLHNDEPLNEQIDRQQYQEFIDKLVDLYFKKDIENSNEEELELEIKHVLEIGESNDY